MLTVDLKNRPDVSDDKKLSNIYHQLGVLLLELQKKDLPGDVVSAINKSVEQINESVLAGNQLRKLVKQKQTTILKLVEKACKIVPKNYYRNMWMLLGFSTFGLPIGVIFGLSMGNIGLLATGLPIGMAIGATVGASMDKKTLNEGRQLQVEIKY
jgi:hypothetical protein